MKSSFGGFDVKRLLYVLADFGPNKRTASIRFYPYRQLDRLQQLDRPATRIQIINDFCVLSWLFGTSRPRLGGEVGHLHSRVTAHTARFAFLSVLLPTVAYIRLYKIGDRSPCFENSACLKLGPVSNFQILPLSA